MFASNHIFFFVNGYNMTLSMETEFEKREDYEYVGHGVTNIFMAMNSLLGDGW